jgi:hypothetical protein
MSKTTTTVPPVHVWGRRGMALVLVGLLLQIVAKLAWSPATFLLSAAVGFPLVLLGGTIFSVAVVRGLRRVPDEAAPGATP